MALGVGAATTPEDAEEAAERELSGIHPTIRAEVAKTMGADVWARMSFVEKLDAVRRRIPTAGDGPATELDREAARLVANGAKTSVDGPVQPLEDNLEEEKEEDDDEEDSGPRYWVPRGRCPYGMDKGHWTVTEAEMRQHNSTHSCWISIDSQVYDATAWLRRHPGGAAAILAFAGGDATDAFRAQGHSARALAQLAQLRIGRRSGPEEDAKERLAATHPDASAEDAMELTVEEWTAMTAAQKLEFFQRRLPNLEPSLISELDARFSDAGARRQGAAGAAAAAGGEAGSAGGCPYGFDRPGGVEAGEATQEKAASAPQPAVCPISGKVGVCPMQAMHGQGAAAPAAEEAPRPQRQGPKPEDACPMS